MSAFGARYPTGEVSETPCPNCGLKPPIVWREGGIFHQRTECHCGRITVWAVCGHDAHADASDDEARIGLRDMGEATT